MAEALYTKYRPQIFEDVVGQEHIERTLKNAIDQDKVSHAYLFCGPRGTGKTTTARLLAKALLCEKGPTASPDGTCEDCRLIAAGEHPDVYELDAASRTGVDNVREEIIGRVQFSPTRGRYKVYIIDEVHMLSTAAFNALLKTLEEPPSHVVFILATTDPQKVPETIHSRCQRFDFRRISSDAMVARLGAVCVSEGVEFEGEALDLIAHRADGGLRNALTSLEQVIAFGEGKATLAAAESILGSVDSSDMAEIMEAVGTRDAAGCFNWVARYVETGADLAHFANDMALRVRNLYVMSLAGADVALEVSDSEHRELVRELPLFGSARLARLLGVLGDLVAELKTATNQRLAFEIALTRMIRPDSDVSLEALVERVEALESGYSATAHVVSVPLAATSAATSAPVGASAAAGGAEGASAGETSATGVTSGAEAFAAERAAQGQPLRDQAAGSPRAERAVGAPQVEQAAQGQSPQGQAVGGSPASAPAAGASALSNPAALQRMWHAVMAALKKEKAAYGVLFLNAKASYDEARGTIVVDFSPDNSFAFNAVQKPNVQGEVERAIVKAHGSAVPFLFTQGGAAPGAAATASPQAERSQAEQRPQAERSQAEQRPSQVEPRPQVESPRQAPASFEPPEPEEVPLDAYGDVSPADFADEGPVTDSPAFATGAKSQAGDASRQAEVASSASAPADDAAFDSSDELAALLAAGGFAGAQVQEMRE